MQINNKIPLLVDIIDIIGDGSRTKQVVTNQNRRINVNIAVRHIFQQNE